MSFVVVVTDYVFPSLELEQRVLAPLGVELRPRQCKSEEEIIELTQGADAVLNCYAKMTARVIEKLGRCKIIARYGIGVDNVDLGAATRAGIVVTNVPDYPPSQKATGVSPWMNARWVPSVALAKEGTLRRVPPDDACGEVPRP